MPGGHGHGDRGNASRRQFGGERLKGITTRQEAGNNDGGLNIVVVVVVVGGVVLVGVIVGLVEYFLCG